ncbi:hypothetical protein CR513_53875, partial [Mucuna pruriens]
MVRNLLSVSYYEPFSIVWCFDDTAYELALLPCSKIHPIFHGSLLKPFHGSDNPNSTALPPEFPLKISLVFSLWLY